MTKASCALAIVIAIVTSVTLSGCDKHEKPAPVAAAESKSTPAVAIVAAASDMNCAEGDVACDERFYQLEETLFAYEAGVAQQIDDSAQACWKVDSERFRRSVDDCKNLACKEKALLGRIASLHFLQSTEQRASLQLPETPPLIAVLAPATADDTPAGLPDPKLEFEARGSLIHAGEHPEHMGIAVSADGKEHVFIYDMDIGNQPGQDEVLGLVGTSPTAQVLVRGQRVVAPTGVSNFDSSQCRWVYELSPP